MMIRAVARGWNVAVVQFIKSGDWNVGEEKIGRQLGVDWHAFGDGFTWDSDDLSNDIAHAAEGWATAVRADGGRRAPARDLRRADLPRVVRLAPDRRRSSSRSATGPRHVNVIVTGRDAAPELIELADTVTEMTEIKHAYQQGIRAMRGTRLLTGDRAVALTLLIGGARSGKSSLAVDIGHRHHAAGIPVTYIATAPPVDDDMAQRIERPSTGAPVDLGDDRGTGRSRRRARRGVGGARHRRLPHAVDVEPDVARTRRRRHPVAAAATPHGLRASARSRPS